MWHYKQFLNFEKLTKRSKKVKNVFINIYEKNISHYLSFGVI